MQLVVRGDWLGKTANMKVANNGAVVYVGSFLTVHNPLVFQNPKKRSNLRIIYSFCLENDVMMIPKRLLLTLIFACLCFLIKTLKQRSLPVDVRRSETELLKLSKNGRELRVAYENLQGTS